MLWLQRSFQIHLIRLLLKEEVQETNLFLEHF